MGKLSGFIVMSDTILLEKNWKPYFAALLADTQSQLFLSSPFISTNGAEFLALHLSEECRAKGVVRVLTNLSPQNVAQGATDPKAIQIIEAAVTNFKLWHLPSLHAKVYVSDAKKAIVTSGNLTAGGLSRNCEYGIGLENEALAQNVLSDLTAYADLGVNINREHLAAYTQIADAVKAQFQQAQKSVKKEIGKTFNALLQDAETELLQARFSQGPAHRIFGKTIVYLLHKHGPLTTQQLHDLIAQIHPDLCNDSVDLLINNRNFGKKWKHGVRSSQVSLKRAGEIELVNGQWRLLNA